MAWMTYERQRLESSCCKRAFACRTFSRVLRFYEHHLYTNKPKQERTNIYTNSGPNKINYQKQNQTLHIPPAFSKATQIDWFDLQCKSPDRPSEVQGAQSETVIQIDSLIYCSLTPLRILKRIVRWIMVS
jgi:hypothetical protein